MTSKMLMLAGAMFITLAVPGCSREKSAAASGSRLADDSSEVEGTFCPDGQSLALDGDALSCSERDRFVNLLDGSALAFTTLAFGASCFPTPYTAITFVVMSGAAVASQAGSYYVKNMDCTPNAPLSDMQQAQVVQLLCKQLGREYQPGSPGTCASK